MQVAGGEGRARPAEVSRGAGAGCQEECRVSWGRLAKGQAGTGEAVPGPSWGGGRSPQLTTRERVGHPFAE